MATKERLVELITARIDEVIPKAENLPGNAIVEAPIGFIEDDTELNAASVEVLRMAKPHLLHSVAKKALNHHPTKATATRVVRNSDGSGFIVLPTDFIRFLRLKLSDWKRPVEELIDSRDPKSAIQSNQFLRGGRSKPKVVLAPFADYTTDERFSNVGNTVPAENVGMALEFYRTDANPVVVSELLYVPKKAATDLPQDLVEPFVWWMAGKALQIMKLYDQSMFAKNQAAAYFIQANFGLVGENWMPGGGMQQPQERRR
jgi:hypothetical protein